MDALDRVTVLRRLTRTLDRLASRVRELLSERIGLSSAEFESLVRAIRSRVELSLSALRDP
jgi:hypothetical protein